MIVTEIVSDCLKSLDLSQATHLAIDAEWYSLNPTYRKGDCRTYSKIIPLSLQLCFSDDQSNILAVVVFWNSTFELPNPMLYKGVEVIVIPTDKLGWECFLDRFNLGTYIKILGFYSPVDLLILLGKSVWGGMLRGDKKGNKLVHKQRNLNVRAFKRTNKHTGQATLFGYQDLMGVANCSYDEFLLSVGIASEYKHLAGGVKDKMNKFMQESGGDFLKYAIGDTVYTREAMERKIQLVNQTVEQALGFNPNFDEANFKYSSGSLVSHVMLMWLDKRYNRLMRAASLLTVTTDNKQWTKTNYLIDLLSKDAITNMAFVEELSKDPKAVHGLAAGSIRAFFRGNYGKGTEVFGALVMGGRAVNERPYVRIHSNEKGELIEDRITERPFRADNILDIDMSGCYGNTLKEFQLPIGIPTTFGNLQRDKKKTWGELLKEVNNQLVPNLWEFKLSVPESVDKKGNVTRKYLSFDQDLLHSKLGLSSHTLYKKLENGQWLNEDDEPEDGRSIAPAHMGGEFALLTRDLQYVSITHDVWEAIKKVATPQELNEFYNLEVVSGVWYPKDKYLDNDQFCELIEDPKKRGADTRKGDSRSRAWTTIPLAGFVEEFLKARKLYKKERDTHPKGSEEYLMYDALQTSTKLFVNVVYGTLCAPYFIVGSTVLANNITARARLGAWMMAKALNLVQTITDGGAFSVDEVCYNKTHVKSFRKPGFRLLFNRNLPNYQRNVETRQLFPGRDFIAEVQQAVLTNDKDRLRQLETEANQKCLAHIKGYWEPYGLNFPYDIELKWEHTATKVAFYNATDYALHTVFYPRKADGTFDLDAERLKVIKVRGTNDINHVKQQFLINILNLQEGEPIRKAVERTSHWCESKGLLGVKTFQANPDKFIAMDIYPGYNEYIINYFWYFDSAGAVYETEDQLRKMKLKKEKQDAVYKSQIDDNDPRELQRHKSLYEYEFVENSVPV